MQCNLCGKEDSLVTSMIEGIEMNVCDSCQTLGTRIQMPKNARRTEIYEAEEYITENFHTLIKNARENKRLKQEDAAKKLAIKESLLHKLENGSFTPSLKMARRLEKFFGIKLVEEGNEERINQNTTKTGSYTIADMMNG